MKLFKKASIVLAALVIMGSAAFARGKTVGINLAIPVNKLTETVSYNGVSGSDVIQFNSFGIGINNFTNNVYTSVDLGFCKNLVINGQKATVNDNVSLMTLNFLGGPGFKVLDNTNMQLIIAPGIHYTINYWKLPSDSEMYFTLGAGADVMFNYFFTSSLGATASLGIAYDFWGISTASLENTSAAKVSYKNLAIKPRFGVVLNY